jgi:hypothetical protein
LVFRRRRLHFVREDVEQHLRIGIGVDVAQILQEHVALELLGVREIAVVREHQAEGRIHVERLRLGGVVGRPRRRVTAVGDAPVADQIAHIAGAENVAHQPRALVHMEAPALCGGDARRILAAMLEHLQPVIEQLVDWRGGDDPEYAAHGLILPVLEALRQRRRQPRLEGHDRGFQRRGE